MNIDAMRKAVSLLSNELQTPRDNPNWRSMITQEVRSLARYTGLTVDKDGNVEPEQEPEQVKQAPKAKASK